MDKIKQIEELLDDWNAKERKINACDQVDLWEARGTANGIGLALAILKEPPNQVVTTSQEPCANCNSYKKLSPYPFCPECGLAIDR